MRILCSANVNQNFNVASGATFQVTLTQSGDAAGLMVQVCAGGLGTSDCTISRQSIAIGQTLSGVRRGGEVQNLSFIRKGCAGTEPFVAGPSTYTATVSYQHP